MGQVVTIEAPREVNNEGDNDGTASRVANHRADCGAAGSPDTNNTEESLGTSSTGLSLTANHTGEARRVSRRRRGLILRPTRRSRSRTRRGALPSDAELDRAQYPGRCSLSRAAMGRLVKASITPRMLWLNETVIRLGMDTLFFRAFFVENENLSSPVVTTPRVFNDSTPIVVAELSGRQAGEVLGERRVRRSRMRWKTQLMDMCVVFRPNIGRAKIWLSGRSGKDVKED
ncbi:hypothetical protein CDD83_1382 [Cordyceps sp. RAO-2017]|nr:hypothetical protein CDD83_1382 [Cordyceps sp. RAO-2017]